MDQPFLSLLFIAFRAHAAVAFFCIQYSKMKIALVQKKFIPSIPFLEGVLCTNSHSPWTHWNGERLGLDLKDFKQCAAHKFINLG